jgi:hypothetical protein
MLDVVNRLADGFVAAHIIAAFVRRGIFSILSGESASAAELSRRLDGNEGHLQIGLRFMDGLGWVDASPNGAYHLTSLGAAGAEVTPPDLDVLLAGLPDHLAGSGAELATWLRRSAVGWSQGEAPHPMSDILDGALLAPVLVELQRRGGPEALSAGEDPFGAEATNELLKLFASRGWAENLSQPQRPQLNAAGIYLVESGAKLGTTLSYWPMFRQMDALLFSNAPSVFQRDDQGHERHLDRRLNIFGSTAQHGSFFREMEDTVVAYFEDLPIEKQPAYIADLGCGDGTLLKRLHAAVTQRTHRGAVLAEHPLTLIAADFNVASLEEASRNLVDLPHLTFRADIGNPGAFVSDLAASGVDPNAVLHVRSFVDHDRPLLQPTDAAALARRGANRDAGVHVDPAGGAIEPAVAVQSLVEHLARWRHAAQGHGLVLLEVHCLRPATIRPASIWWRRRLSCSPQRKPG